MKFSNTVMAIVVLVAVLSILNVVVKQMCFADTPGIAHMYEKGENESAILFSPFRIDFGEELSQGRVYLIAKNGALLHSWDTDAPVLTSILDSNGDLWVAKATSKNIEFPDPGTTGTIERISWSGESLWEYTDPEMMIDFEVLPHGGVAYLRWSKAPEWSNGGKMRWSNEIVVVNPQKEIIWTWKFSDHVSMERFDATYVNPIDVVHTNSIRFIQSNPITQTPAFLVSARHLSTVYLIDVETKKILWQSPFGLFSYQHDASLVGEDTILVFDNGFARKGVGALLSRVAEVSISSNEIAWKYDGGKTITGKAGFASSVMGAADRLRSGNTLITLSTQGLFTEVDREGQIVWEYQYTARDHDQELPIVFRARSYEIDANDWKERIIVQRYFCGSR